MIVSIVYETDSIRQVFDSNAASQSICAVKEKYSHNKCFALLRFASNGLRDTTVWYANINNPTCDGAHDEPPK